MSPALYKRPGIIQRIRKHRCAVIEASAGTGKTFAIEHLVLDLLLSGECAVEQILVVTFTEKATAELRIRIREAIAKFLVGTLDQPPGGETDAILIDDTKRQLLDRAYRGFDRAPIFTIHGFCHRVLTDFAFQSGALLELELTDSRGAFHHAFRAVLRDQLAVGKQTRALLEKWLAGTGPDSKGMSPDDIERLLFEAYQRRYLRSRDFNARSAIIQALMDHYDGDSLRKLCQHLGLTVKKLAKAIDVIDRLDEAVAQAGGSSQRMKEALANIDVQSLVEPILASALPGTRAEYKKALDLAGKLNEADAAAKSREWELVDAFLPPVAERLQHEKRERGLIDYDDMLSWVAGALEGAGGPALIAALRDRFHCALVDEFQDTDDLQWEIFRRVFAATDSGTRLYVVGDPKQAIYAFRGADVFTYLKARRALATSADSVIQLDENFRSTSDLINACNHIFDRNAPEALFQGEISYDQPVRCGRPERKALDRRHHPIVPVVLMRYRKREGKASAAELRLAIGRHIAEQLRQILTAGEQQITIEDKDQAPRCVEPEHVFVLTRTRQESAEIGGYLGEAGVPFKFYKQEGLFQTPEATHVLDVLRAVAQPHLRSNRLKAWLSPFFSVPLRDLALINDVPPGNALNERLYEWRGIAERGHLAELFDALLHQSGVTARELFLTGGERRLTNYQHIFELLLSSATAGRLDLEQLIALLEDYIAERAMPQAGEPNIQRLESERQAVSVITVHMSKGLEADVVALFGGFGRINARGELAVYHDDRRERRFAIGKAARDCFNRQLTREQEEEDQRLLYVGLTRARARLYLPLIPKDSTKMKPNGYYAALNTRLLAIEEEPRGGKSKLFAIQDVAEPSADGYDSEGLSRRLAAWTPPPSLLQEPGGVESEGTLWNLRCSRWPLVMRSYTSLRRAEQEQRWDIPDEEFKRDLESAPEAGDLPGGREVGLFLHEVIEKATMEPFAECFEHWRKRDDVIALLRAAMRRHQVKEPWFERGAEIVFAALTTQITLPDGRRVGPLCQCRSTREMEFVYPIPEAHHPLLAAPASGQWTAERGYLKGFVDFVFEQDGLTYFADWKSDQLLSYEPAALEQHVREHYLIQARIYTIGVLRLLQIRSESEYQSRFGGLLYIFLRGVGADGRRGVYFHRPAWSEVCAYESELMHTTAVQAIEP
jgi:exodeoxyribonuclease V beta subunit